jgi:hypothetical protein
MQISGSYLVAICLGISHLTFFTHALVTLQTITNLTEVTDQCRERIVQGGAVGNREGVVEIDEMARVLGGIDGGLGGGQTVLRGEDDEGEVEDVSHFSCFLDHVFKRDKGCFVWLWLWVRAVWGNVSASSVRPIAILEV